jgi:hypothetical protein
MNTIEAIDAFESRARAAREAPATRRTRARRTAGPTSEGIERADEEDNQNG